MGSSGCAVVQEVGKGQAEPRISSNHKPLLGQLPIGVTLLHCPVMGTAAPLLSGAHREEKFGSAAFANDAPLFIYHQSHIS